MTRKTVKRRVVKAIAVALSAMVMATPLSTIVSFAEEAGVVVTAEYQSAELAAAISALQGYDQESNLSGAFYRKADAVLKDYVITQLTAQGLSNVQQKQMIYNSSADNYNSNYFLFEGVNAQGAKEYYFYDYVLVDKDGNELSGIIKVKDVAGMNILKKTRVYVNGDDVLTYGVDGVGKIVYMINGEPVNAYYVDGSVLDDSFTVANEVTYYTYADGNRVADEDVAKIQIGEDGSLYIAGATTVAYRNADGVSVDESLVHQDGDNFYIDGETYYIDENGNRIDSSLVVDGKYVKGTTTYFVNGNGDKVDFAVSTVDGAATYTLNGEAIDASRVAVDGSNYTVTTVSGAYEDQNGNVVSVFQDRMYFVNGNMAVEIDGELVELKKGNSSISYSGKQFYLPTLSEKQTVAVGNKDYFLDEATITRNDKGNGNTYDIYFPYSLASITVKADGAHYHKSTSVATYIQVTDVETGSAVLTTDREYVAREEVTSVNEVIECTDNNSTVYSGKFTASSNGAIKGEDIGWVIKFVESTADDNGAGTDDNTGADDNGAGTDDNTGADDNGTGTDDNTGADDNGTGTDDNTGVDDNGTGTDDNTGANDNGTGTDDNTGANDNGTGTDDNTGANDNGIGTNDNTVVDDNNQAPAAQQPAQTEAPATQQPAQNEAPAAQQPAQTEAPAAQQPAQNEAPAAQQPAQNVAPAAQQPVQNNEAQVAEANVEVDEEVVDIPDELTALADTVPADETEEIAIGGSVIIEEEETALADTVVAKSSIKNWWWLIIVAVVVAAGTAWFISYRTKKAKAQNL